MKIEFCLPVYNETEIFADNLGRLMNFLVAQKYDFDWQVVVTVNGSSDQFVALADKEGRQYQPRVKTMVFPEKGKGLAIKKYAQISDADVLVYMDIDLAVDLGDIQALITPIINDQADMIIGSRMLPASIKERSFIREASSQIYVWLSRLILRHNFSDLQCGFKAVKVSLLKNVVGKIKDDQWFFDTELIYYALQRGARIQEIPVNWSENRYQLRKSKINMLADGVRFIKKLLVLRFGKE